MVLRPEAVSEFSATLSEVKLAWVSFSAMKNIWVSLSMWGEAASMSYLEEIEDEGSAQLQNHPWFCFLRFDSFFRSAAF